MDEPSLVDVCDELVNYVAVRDAEGAEEKDFDAWLRNRYREFTIEFTGYESLMATLEVSVFPGDADGAVTLSEWALCEAIIGYFPNRMTQVRLSTGTVVTPVRERAALRESVAEYVASIVYRISYEKVCAAAGF